MTSRNQTVDHAPANGKVWFWPLVLGGTVVLVASIATGMFLVDPTDDEILTMLASDDPETRRWGAWEAASEPSAAASAIIAQRLSDQLERAPEVRESFVYALSQSGQREHFDLIAEIVRNDDSPYVRQAAWVAAGRLDPGRFRMLITEVTPRDDPWDEIGRADGWLFAGDVRGVPALLRWARDGTTEQRQVASMALLHRVAPLLEVAGRWPIDADTTQGKVWSTDFVDEIARRCAQLDLQAVLDDTRAYAERTARIRRDVGRLHNTSDHIADYISSQ